MSDLRSPLNSPVALMCQFAPGLPRLPAPTRVRPFISQMYASPLSFCHRMSDLPSPLKSPVALMCQLAPGLPRLLPPITVVPLISRIAAVPSVLCQKMSEEPSPKRSLGNVGVESWLTGGGGGAAGGGGGGGLTGAAAPQPSAAISVRSVELRPFIWPGRLLLSKASAPA